jgi:diacylglycerol kinase (ATP)
LSDAHLAGAEIDSRCGVRQHDKPVPDFSEILRRTKSVVFVNPVAGAGRAERNLRRVRGAFERMELSADFVVAGSAVEMEARVLEALAQGPRLLFAMGGDGTVQTVVNAIERTGRLAEADMVIGALPSGGGNDFASALGLPKDPVAVITSLRGMTIRTVDLLHARTADGAARLLWAAEELGST